MSRAHTGGAWRPLSARESEDEAEAYRALHTGVPPWLRESLWEWIAEQIYDGWSGSDREVWSEGLRQLERELRFSADWDGKYPRVGLVAFRDTLRSDPKLMLDVADYLISHVDFRPYNRRGDDSIQPLDQLLEQSGSAYKVERDEHLRSARLIRRVDIGIEAAAKRAMEQQTTSSILLRHAWNATYGLHPNASEGYRQAVRAVEAAAIPVILPNDGNATLGRVIGTLRGSTARWQLSFTHRTKPEEPITTLIAMMALLWEGQYDRHVSEGVALHVSSEEAETALHLAATLVQWFTTGRVSRRT